MITGARPSAQTTHENEPSQRTETGRQRHESLLSDTSESSDTPTRGSPSNASKSRLSPADDPCNSRTGSILHESSWTTAGSQQSKFDSSFLYASFSTGTRPPAPKPPPSADPGRINSTATQSLLQRTLYERYPPCIADYISLHSLLTSCTSHLNLLRESPNVRQDSDFVHERQRDLLSACKSIQDQVDAIEESMKASREQCLKEGHELLEIDQILAPPLMKRSKHRTQMPAMDSDEEDWKDAPENTV